MNDLSLSQWDEEFNPKCSTRNCEADAEWMCWALHGAKKCPHSGFTCTPCKEMVRKWWEEALVVKAGGRCLVCRELVGGQLSDNLRWIPL